MRLVSGGVKWLIILVALTVIVLVCGCLDTNVVALSYDNDGTTVYETNGSGQHMYIHNNPCSHDPTYQEMINFILADDTDKIRYNENSFVCLDYAARVHDNSEKDNISCAVVCLTFSDGLGHALNAFNTTDRGWVYVDCTGDKPGEPFSHDKIATFAIGKRYEITPMTNIGNYYYEPNSDGVVVDYEIFWKNNVNRNGIITYGFVWPTIALPNISLPSISLPSINWPSPASSSPTPMPVTPTTTWVQTVTAVPQGQYGDISGWVYNSAGPVAHATISYSVNEGYLANTPMSVTADNNGYYSITHLPYSTYKLTVWDGTGSSILGNKEVIVNSKLASMNLIFK